MRCSRRAGVIRRDGSEGFFTSTADIRMPPLYRGGVRLPALQRMAAVLLVSQAYRCTTDSEEGAVPAAAMYAHNAGKFL